MKKAEKICIVVLSCVIFLTHAAISKTSPKILVLGFKSPQLTDVQDRLLREHVLRFFVNNNYTIVTVMEIESIALLKGRNIRSLSQKEITKLADSFNADYVITGIIENKSKANIVEQGQNASYKCTIKLLHKQTRAQTTYWFKLKGERDLLQFYAHFAKQVLSFFTETVENK